MTTHPISERSVASSVSRREFVKKTSAAVGAASVGMAAGGGVVSTAGATHAVRGEVADGNMPRSLVDWSITGRELDVLWSKVWPKIVALYWKNPSKPAPGGGMTDYRQEFTTKMTFRIGEATRIASLLRLTYTSNIPIHIAPPEAFGITMRAFIREMRTMRQSEVDLVTTCYAGMYGRTFFVITEDGIFMPWPDVPTISEIQIGYVQGGGRAPRRGIPAGSPSLGDMENFPTNLTGGVASPALAEGLSGVALLVLVEKWDKMVALAWEDGPSRRADMIAQPKKYIMPEVWSTWPEGVVPTVNSGADDIVIQHQTTTTERFRITVPVPDKPDNLDDYLDELIVGQASNPMYSNCY